jgi:hypothetical protein
MSPGKLLEHLWVRLSDHPSQEAKDAVNELETDRRNILADCQEDPEQLIRWLYENQGVRRFDSSNRLFLSPREHRKLLRFMGTKASERLASTDDYGLLGCSSKKWHRL